ncbi:MAG: hypothetical protein AUJ37_02320 [Candidatus Magasanikbacteria bacterium CG1_02_41_34]|uniref:Multidrug ABC transporter substrate-binding protein n=1 Tax=Candidatus Magasanikbacteria bacterium CG_4_10_14_0_2_um_filter_41_31 TaxID=1974639 RepID=A0A2M7V3R9_9BACT|nr:MAG: hypothetical protein AUJ37_02320 [Candidatus Magasanikbacteria bacterium CG1_02_41_34]PIZ93164.1 MAG: multidrug ABC transporter substrate-binding protein [Candidatus Magasanikbacteria bacterium CG_4_10_14_0_2_um_filter_41_31]
MTIIDSYKTALKNFRINKRRSMLTMLGLIIGISSVILVMSTGAGAQSLITGQLEKRGTDQIVVLAGASDPSGPPAQALGIVITTLTEEDKDALLDTHNVSHLAYAAGYITGNGILKWGSESKSVSYTGANADYEIIEKVTVRDGRFFTASDNEAHEPVIVIGNTVAEDVFGNSEPVGERVKIGGKQFRVIGVLATQGSSIFEDVDNAVIMPLRVAQYDMLGVRHITFIRSQMDDTQYLDQTVEEIRQTLIDRHGEEDFSIRNTADALAILTTITNALKFFLVAIAGVSLFVGGIGIMNIMLISVQEKTREVGLRKSVGATDKDILKQFLIETIVLSLLGGIIGLAIGILFAFGIAKGVQAAGYPDYQFIVSFGAIVVSLVVTTLIGLVFGVYPARRAAQLDPIDALHYE